MTAETQHVLSMASQMLDESLHLSCHQSLWLSGRSVESDRGPDPAATALEIIGQLLAMFGYCRRRLRHEALDPRGDQSFEENHFAFVGCVGVGV